jgi:membrane-bound metal-dependent hydrolase YbcI (DUF457 family)
VPTPISHATVGYALGIWTQRGVPMRRVCLAAAACAALPDIDLLFFPFIEHRAITHSLAFAFVVALLASVMAVPGIKWREGRWRIVAVLGIAILSHSLLDALSRYSYGIEFFAPFSGQRYRFLWTPLGDPAGRLSHQLLQEALVVLLPAMVAVGVGLRVKPAR